MSQVPVVHKEDHKRAIIASVIAFLFTLFLLFFIKWHEPDPPKVTVPIPLAMMEDGIDDFDIYNAGGGEAAPTETETTTPEPTPQEVATQEESPVETVVGSNESDASSQTTSQQTEAQSSPFSGSGSGGSGSSGSGTGFGPDSGPGIGTGEPGSGGSGERVRLTNIKSKPRTVNNTRSNIAFKLTVDEFGSVIGVSVIRANTTTTNQRLIDEVIDLVKKEVQYVKKPGARPEVTYYTITVEPS